MCDIPCFPFPGRALGVFTFIVLVSVLVLCGAVLPASAQNSGDVPTPEIVAQYLTEIRDLAQEALAASRRAEEATSVADVKQHADVVFATIWGVPSGLAEDTRGAAQIHGWKTRWQVTFADFDSAFAARYGSLPPETGDPGALGIVGRGRHVRAEIEAMIADENGTEAGRTHGEHVVNALNNVIGWMKMDDGVTKGERQPRVDLTREWDSPIEFWMSTADTGWMHEVFAQSLNILKTDYEGDADMARRHAAGMTELIEKALEGVDADGDGSVKPVKMEGGIETAIQHAEFGGYIE